MTTLDIVYSAQDEAERVRFTISKLPWYEENGYKVDLPIGVDGGSSESEVEQKTTEQYSEGEYETAASFLQTAWQDFLPRFDDVINQKVLSVSDSYTVKLTMYGTGGSYYPDKNLIVLKFRNKTPGQMLGTIVHEITHISIHSLIEEFKVSHWRKERLVDLILEHYFPGLKPPQKITEDVQIVDDSFRQNFPDLRKLISGLSG